MDGRWREARDQLLDTAACLHMNTYIPTYVAAARLVASHPTALAYSDHPCFNQLTSADAHSIGARILKHPAEATLAICHSCLVNGPCLERCFLTHKMARRDLVHGPGPRVTSLYDYYHVVSVPQLKPSAVDSRPSTPPFRLTTCRRHVAVPVTRPTWQSGNASLYLRPWSI